MSFAAGINDAQWIGQEIGSFQVLRLLGRGAMGAVFLAEDSVLKRKVALKLLPKGDDHSDSDKLQRFLREARSAARIIHPNVVQVFQIGDLPRHRFIAMEYVNGMTLQDRARMHGGQLPQGFAIARFLEAADALRFAANLGICHRDLKPQNLLLTKFERLKIADFGLAAQVDGGESIGRGAGGQIEGTPAYMSPEQWGDGTMTPASDIYGIGCAFFSLLAGKPPYSATDLVGYLRAHCGNAIPDIRDLVPDIHEPLGELLGQCMAKQPNARPSAGELFDRLDNMAQLLSIRSSRTSVPPTTPPTKGSSPSLPKRAPRVPRPKRRGPPPLPTAGQVGKDDDSAKSSWPVASGIEPSNLSQAPMASVVVSTLESQPQADEFSRSRTAVSFTAAQPAQDAGKQVTAPALPTAEANADTTETSYRDRYGFCAYPFSDIRQPEHYWDGGPYSQVVGRLTAGLGSSGGLQIVVGESGSGKTFACEMLASTRNNFRVVTLDPTMLFGTSLLPKKAAKSFLKVAFTK